MLKVLNTAIHVKEEVKQSISYKRMMNLEES